MARALKKTTASAVVFLCFWVKYSFKRCTSFDNYFFFVNYTFKCNTQKLRIETLIWWLFALCLVGCALGIG